MRFITQLRLRLPLGSRMGCAPIFANAIAIPIYSIEKNHIRNGVIYRRYEWTITAQKQRTVRSGLTRGNTKCY